METLHDDRRITAAGLASLVTVYLVWGSTYLAIRFGVREGSGFPPFALGAMRTFAAGSALFLWALARRTSIRISRSEVFTLALAGLLMWPGANGLVNWAEQRADSSYAALLVAAMPIWTALIDAIWRRRWPSWRLMGFLLVGFAGIGLLTVPQLRLAEGADMTSILLLVLAPVTWSVGTLLQIHRPVRVSPLTASAYLNLFGSVGFALLWVLAGEPMPHPTAEAWGALAYLIVAGSIIAYTAYVRTLRMLPTSIAMTYAYVNPVVAVLLGWALLRESITVTTGVGMVVILIGVWGVFREKRHRPAPTMDH